MSEKFNKIAAAALFCVAAVSLFAAPPHSWDKKPDSYFWYVDKENKVRFLPPQDKGWKYSDVKKVKVPKSRPIPRVSFGKGNAEPGLGTLKKEVIPLELLEESGYPRNNSEVRVGIPFPRYGIYNLQNLKLRRPDGYEVPAQFAELSRWPDGSLRFVLASFHANLKANEKAIWKLEAGSDIRQSAPRSFIKLTEKPDKYLIDTGIISAEISKTDFQLPVNVTAKGGKKLGGFKGITIVAADGRKLTTSGKPDRITVEEQGPEHLTILSEGKLLPAAKHGAYKYQIRMRFRKSSPIIRVELGLINADLTNEYFDIKEAYCELESAFGSRSVSAGLGKNSIHGRSIRQMTWNQVQHGRNKLKGTLQSWFALNTHNKKERISVAVADAAKLWPKGVSSDGKTFRIELLPPLNDKNFGKNFPHHLAYCFCAGNHRQKWGMKFVTPILADFTGSSLPILAAEADKSIVAVLPGEWYEKCEVFVGTNATVPGVDHRIEEMLKDNDISAERDVESGYYNYGDWFGERRRNWGNNEYDTPYSYFCQFLRTGNRKLFRLGMAGARHQSDTDTVHATPNPRVLGGMPYHGIGHTGSADYTIGYWSPTKAGFTGIPNNGHTWVRGRLAAFMLAGEARCMDSALLCGEQLYRQSWMQTKMSGAPRVTAWMLTALCALYENTCDPVYMTGAHRLFETQYREQDFKRGGVWARKKNRLKGDGQTTFMLGVIGISHLEYHRLFGDPRALKSLQYICDWMLGAFHPGEVGYYYDSGWDHKNKTFVVCFVGPYTGSVLMYTAAKTGNKKYVEVADQLLKMQLSRGFGVKKDMSISMLQLNEWLGYRKAWQKKHPADKFTYDLNSWYNECFTRQQPAFHARSKEPIIFRITLKKESGKIRLKRNQLNVRQADIKLADAKGNILWQTTAPKEKNVNEFLIPFKGKKGDQLTLTVFDNDNAFWDLFTSDDYYPEAKLTKLYMLRRPNLRRYYFNVPAGTKEFTVKLFPRNTGFINAMVRRPDGSSAGYGEGCNHSISTKLPTDADAEKWWVRIPVKTAPAAKDTTWSIDYAACIDGGLAFEGIPGWISIAPPAK